jgi:hypothetical protein
MTRDELRRYYNELNNAESYTNDYVKKYLVPYWMEKSEKRNLADLISPHFANVHLVEGGLSQEKAVQMCVERSGYGANNFTSTVLATNFVEKIARYITNNIIELHGKHRGVFTNYQVPERGMMITVTYNAEKKQFNPTQYSDQVVVGIDREGLITHFHGDAQYATGDIYINAGSNLSKLNDK